MTQQGGRRTVAERRAQLLELGLDLFGSKPYDEISIEEIAQLAHMSKGLLYHYFPSKRDFYVACLRAASGQLRRTVRPDTTQPPGQQLRTSLAVYLDHVRDNLPKVQAFVRGGIGSDPEVMEVIEGTRRAVWEYLLAALRATEEDHLLRYAVQSWVRFVEMMALSWAESGAVEKEDVIEVCATVLETAVREARRTRQPIEAEPT